MADFFDQLRDHVADGETVAALEGLSDYLKGRLLAKGPVTERIRRALNEITLHRGALVRERLRERMGLGGDHASVVNRVAQATLELIDDAARSSRTAPKPADPGQPAIDLSGPVAERIWGLGNLRSLSWVRKGLIAARAVCRIDVTDSTGSGFLIEGGWIVTNHHVLRSPVDAGRAQCAFGFEEDDNGALQAPICYRLDADSHVADHDLDCAMARIMTPEAVREATEHWGTLAVDRVSQLSPGQHVAIIQHPGGGPKRICMTDNQVVNIYEHRLHYMTDTMPGSSGSPVFSDDWGVVALHRAGGQLAKNARGDKIFANEGVLFSAIASRDAFARILSGFDAGRPRA